MRKPLYTETRPKCKCDRWVRIIYRNNKISFDKICDTHMRIKYRMWPFHIGKRGPYKKSREERKDTRLGIG